VLAWSSRMRVKHGATRESCRRASFLGKNADNIKKE